MPDLTIDGAKVSVEPGKTVLDAARVAGVDIPTLCHSEHLLPFGSCRLCTVEVGSQGRFRLQASCAYPAEEGLEVKTGTERVVRGRKIMAELLLARCSGVPAVKKMAAGLGVETSRFSPKGETCVLCGQCVRICAEVVGAGAISFADRGILRKVLTPFDKHSEKCLACGVCTYVCPTGHIQMEAKTRSFWQKSLQPAERLCRYARIGFFSRKICPNDFRCQTCEVDQQMEEMLADHPALVSRPADRFLPARIGDFELMPSYYYTSGHMWAVFLDGVVRLGIDDFARSVLGRIDKAEVAPLGTRIGPAEVLWELHSGDRKLSMLSPLAGKIVSINPYLEVDPQLSSRDPHGRGWILMIQPDSREEAERLRSALCTGSAAHDWLSGVSREFDDWSKQEQATPGSLDNQQWNALVSTFFVNE